MTQITRCHAKVEISLHKKIVALELNLLSIAFLESIEIRKMTIRATAPQLVKMLHNKQCLLKYVFINALSSITIKLSFMD